MTDVKLDVAREIAGEMQRGIVSTGTGYKHITDVSKRAVTEAWRQAGQIIEALVQELERGELLGYVVLEPDRTFGDFNLMLGTPIFPSDDRESADECLAGDAFIAEVRRPNAKADGERG